MQKKCILVLVLFYYSSGLFPQIGIGTKAPLTTFDVVSNNPSNPSDNTGLTVPRVSVNPVKGIEKGQLIFNTTINKFQYWDGTIWTSFDSLGNNLKIVSQDTRTSSFITIDSNNTQAILIPGLSYDFNLNKTSTVELVSYLNFKSNSSSLYPKFLLRLTNLADSSVIRENEVTQLYLSDGIIDTQSNLQLSSVLELPEGNYKVEILGYKNECCALDFSYQVGGNTNISSLLVRIL